MMNRQEQWIWLALIIILAALVFVATTAAVVAIYSR